MASTITRSIRPSIFHSIDINSVVFVSVVPQGTYYVTIGEHADLWLGHMLTESGGYKIVCCSLIYRGSHAHCVIKVALKKVRGGYVEKRPDLKGQIAQVASAALATD
jgi:hypothetical protein